MSGGNINVDAQAGNNLATSTMLCSIGALATVNWSGGVVTVVDPHRAATASASLHMQIQQTTNKIITGGKLRIGDGSFHDFRWTFS